MAAFATMALAFHTLLCAGFVALGVFHLAGGIGVVESGPESPDWGRTRLNLLFYLSGGLYLIYAEVYLYQVQTLARIGS